MKKPILLLTIPILLIGIFFLYNSYVPIEYKNECNDKHLYRYQFGIYQIDSMMQTRNLQQLGGVKEYFGFTKQPCEDSVRHYTNLRLTKGTDSLNNSLKWRLIKDNLYINKNGDLGFKEYKDLGDEGLTRVTDYITKFGFNEGKTLKSVIDTTTFKDLGSNFYKDKKHIYHYYSMLGGGQFYIDTNVDYKTFEVIGDVYAKDKNQIYLDRTGIMENIDYKTFKTAVGIGPYAKDKNGYYRWGDKIDTLNHSDEYDKEAIKILDKLR
ncbi:MAG: hypothetical protein EOP00_27405 [Pedobacter sp.]|nr:MAG: hypothetical protein EOP00_27405 [Pedobacter sp.]